MAEHRLLSIVPVGLREAVIDSPPFRASTRHFEDQVDALEKWLEGYIKIMSDWMSNLQRTPQRYRDVNDRTGGIDEYPVYESGAIVFYGGVNWCARLKGALMRDPDYTFLAMTRFSEALKQFWGTIFAQAKELRETMILSMAKFLREDIREIKVVP
jgi:BAR domain of APPL family